VAYVFTIAHLPTAEAQKLRDADKAKKQAAIDKATKILAEEQKKAGANPQPVASGELPVEPKVLSYGIPRAPDSVVDLHDEIAVHLLDVEIPKSIQDAIDKANKAEQIWNPAEKDLALLKSSWKTLKPRAKSEYSRIQWKVVQDKYLDSIRSAFGNEVLAYVPELERDVTGLAMIEKLAGIMYGEKLG
jgi:hypothetical protein